MKGGNDCALTVAALSEKLYDCAVTPYYLHLLDPVHGASHLDIPVDRANQIYRELQNTVPGFFLPKLVREIFGEFSKTVISFNILL